MTVNRTAAGKDTNGSGNVTLSAETLTAHQHVLILVWNFSTLPDAGKVVYEKDGGGEVSLGDPIQAASGTGSDKIGSYFLRDVAAGSYVFKAKSLPYVGIIVVILDGKANCWVQATVGNGTGTGTSFASGAITPRFASAVAVGFCTHNTDGASPETVISADTGNGWTLVADLDNDDYDGDAQPGACQYKALSGTPGEIQPSVTSTFTCNNSTGWISLLVVVSDPDSFYVIQGGTTKTAATPINQCWFGRDSDGGADSEDTIEFARDITAHNVRTISPAIPADQLIAPMLGLYGSEADASMITASGSGNTVQRDVTAPWGSGNPASATVFSCKLASACASVTYTGPPSGFNGRYGGFACLVIENPHATDYRSVTGVARVVDTSHTTIDPGGVTPLVPDYDDCIVVMVFTNQGHSSDLLPLTYDSANFLAALCHSQLNADENVPDANTTGSTHNSDHNSFSFLVRRYTAGTPYAPTVQFATTSGYSRSAVMAFNLAGSNPVGGGSALPIIMQMLHG